MLEGTVVDLIEDRTIIDVSGVGYEVNLAGMKVLVEEDIKVYIFTYVREDAIKLFGFKDKYSLLIFEKLLSVSGVGPKSAISLVSEYTPQSLVSSIMSENTKGLKVKGIGEKTAKKIILELKNKVQGLGITPKGEKEENGQLGRNTKKSGEVKDALLGLGYSTNEIKQTLKKIKEFDQKSIEDLLKEALSYLRK